MVEAVVTRGRVRWKEDGEVRSAVRDERIELSDEEFERLSALDAVKYPEDEDEGEEPALDDTSAELDSLSKAELKALADERGIAYPKDATNAELISLLQPE